MPFFIYWFKSSNTSLTIALLRGVSRVTSSPFSVGKSLSFINVSKASPVSALPSFSSIAQLRQRNSSGMMESKGLCSLLALYSHVSSCVSYTFRKNIHVICSMRCASPLIPASCRMIFCRRFTILFTAISLCYFIYFVFKFF